MDSQLPDSGGGRPGQQDYIASRRAITRLRERAEEAMKDNNIEDAKQLYHEARFLTGNLRDDTLFKQIIDDTENCNIIDYRNKGREKRDQGNIKAAEDLLSTALGIADTAKWKRGVDRPQLIQELHEDLYHCQALLLKENGKEAFNSGDYVNASVMFSSAMIQAKAANKDEIVLQLLINRSLACSKIELHEEALEDARLSIEIAPERFYKGYYRFAQVCKDMKDPLAALNALRNGLSMTDPPTVDQAAFVMEVLTLTTQLGGQLDEAFRECHIRAETWIAVLKDLASKQKWLQIKQLVILDESLENMENCGQRVAVTDLLQYCENGGSGARDWGQKLAIEMFKRGSSYPKDNSVAMMKRALDFGIKEGDFRLLKYIFKMYAKTEADRNANDQSGENLYRYLVDKNDTGKGSALIALNLLENHGIGVCAQVESPIIMTGNLKENQKPKDVTPIKQQTFGKDMVDGLSKNTATSTTLNTAVASPAVVTTSTTTAADQTRKTPLESRSTRLVVEQRATTGTHMSAVDTGSSVTGSKQGDGGSTTSTTSTSRAPDKQILDLGVNTPPVVATLSVPSTNQNISSGSTGKGKQNQKRSYQCNKCRHEHEKANKYKSYMHEKACAIWVKIISEGGHRPGDHNQWKKKAQSGIMDVLKKNKEVSNSLTLLSAEEFSYFVVEAGHIPDWELVEQLIISYEDKNGKESINNLATDIDLTKYFKDRQRKLTTLEIMLKAGASAIKESMYKTLPLKEAMEYADWGAIPLLVEYGANVETFRLTQGDTPIHAALQVAMKKDKSDDFNVLQRLFELHQSDPERLSSLNPQRQDSFGDTLFHVAAKENDLEIGLKAVKFLFGKVNPNLLNNDGKTALQCLQKKNDRRAQEIRVAGEFFQESASGMTSGQKKASRTKEYTRQVSSDPKSPLPITDESGSLIRTDLRKIDAKRKRRHAKQIREDIQKFLDNIDEEESYFSEDDLEEEDDAIEGYLENRKQDCLSDVRLVENPDRRQSDIADERENQDAGTNESSICTAEQHPTAGVLITQLQSNYVDHQGSNATPKQMEPSDLQPPTKTDDESNDERSDGENDDDIDPSSFKGLAWDIECTSEVWNTLYKKTLDRKMRNRIFKKIQMLASGEFNNQPHLMKLLHSTPKHIKLYEAKITKAARLIWEIDIAFSSRQTDPSTIRLTDNRKELHSTTGKSIYAEVIRLWDIVFNHDNIFRSVQNVVKSHSKGEECLLQKKLEGIKGKEDFYSEDGKRIPRTFSEVDEGLKVIPFFPPASAKETEYHIMKWYNFDFLVNSILQDHGAKVDFPFSVTEREYAIINIKQNPPCPLLLLGRSGTGKTTCCLYRLWSRFMYYWKRTSAENPLMPRPVSFFPKKTDDELADDEENDDKLENPTSNETACADLEFENESPDCDHLHQVFITKNPVLCSEISKNFRYLSHGCPESKPRVDVEDNPLPTRLQLAHPCSYPLFLTSKQFLMILDASLPAPYFFLRNEDGSLKREIAGWGEEDGPLTFIPDMDDDVEVQLNEEDDIGGAALQPDKNRDPRREVTYELFVEKLWPEILKSEKERVNCHPSLVWTEINSFIKGTIEAMHSEEGYLDMETYDSLGKKRAPNFPGSRVQVYQLFKTYAILIKRRGWFDEMDLIFNLYDRLQTVTNPECFIHEVYVDETQDFTQAELALLIRCCNDPNNMFLTGDTAQSIMRGIAFRFEDLKSLFYYAKESHQGKTRPVNVPRIVYQLINNYRSHAGILNLATSLLDLIDRFFPASYDRKGLEKDRGLFKGPLPVLIDCCSYSDLAVVLCGNKRETSQIEFGAHQAVIVVNDEARENLPDELSFGLVLTIYESKGLEFDDILLYNFFKDSQAKEEWRVVIQHLDEIISEQEESSQANSKEVLEIDTEACSDRNRPRPLEFDPEKHKILNSELKHLYTAVTRARVNIWIFDEDEAARKPMFRYFQARKLVKTVEAKGEDGEEGLSDLFPKKSTPAEWKLRGDDLFKKCLYKVAAECYRKAGRDRRYRLCIANQHALEAKRTEDRHQKRENYLAVALEYLTCHEYLHAANCLYNAKEFKMAASLYANDKVRKYNDAARLYKTLRGFENKACEMYELGKLYKDAIHLYNEQNKYGKALDVLRRYQKTIEEYKTRNQPIPQKVFENQPCPSDSACNKCNLGKLALKAAQQYLQSENNSQMLECLDLVGYEEAIMFLMKKKLKGEAAIFYQKHGKIVEAAEIYKGMGELDKAIQCFDEAKDDIINDHDQVMCGELKLEKAKTLIKHTASKKAEELLKSAQVFFANHKEYMKEAECLLLQGIHCDIKNDIIRGNLLLKAYQKFGNGYADCSVGEIESVYQVVKLLPERLANLQQCTKLVLRAIELALDLSKWLKHPTDGPTVKATEAVKKCLKFYGLLTFGSVDKSTLEIANSEAQILSLLDNGSFKGGQMVPKQEAKNIIVRDLLGEKVSLLWRFAQRIAKEAKEEAMPCPQYRLGFECTNSTEDHECPYRHKAHDRKSLEALFQSSILIMQLDSGIARAREVPELQTDRDIFESHFSSVDAMQSFDELCRIVFPPDRQEATLFGGAKITDAFLEGFRQPSTKALLLWNVSSKMEQFVAKDRLAKYRSSDLYFLLHSVYLLVGESKKILQLLLDTEKDENPPTFIGFEVINVNRNKTVRHHIFRYIVNMNTRLYNDQNPMDTIGHCDKFFYEVGRRRHTRMFPSFAYTMVMFEYQLALSYCMFLKNIGGSDHAFLPKSYLAHITYMDCAYGGTAQRPTFSIIDSYRAEQKYIVRLKGGLWSFVKLFCGQRSQDFHMLKDVFKEESPWIETGEAERVFIFALVLLVNINKAIPNTWGQARKSAEFMLMSDIAAIIPDETFPKRLRVAIEATKSAKGLRGIGMILSRLLRERSDEELMDCTWALRSNKRRNFCSKELTQYGLINDAFYRYRPDDRRTPVESESSHVAEVQDNEPDTDKELEDEAAADYAKNVLLQQEAHQVVDKEDELDHQVLSKPDKTIDVNLQIDDTMCNTCGVKFTEGTESISNVNKSGESSRTEDPKPGVDELLPAFIKRQISTDSDTVSSQPLVTRYEHEVSEAHEEKQEQCRLFLEYLKQNVVPLQQEVDPVQPQAEGAVSLTDSELHVQGWSQRLGKLITMHREKRDWSNTESIKEMCKTLKDAIEALKKGLLTTEPQVVPEINEDVAEMMSTEVEGDQRPELETEEEALEGPEKPVAPEPVKRINKKNDYRGRQPQWSNKNRQPRYNKN